MFALVDGNNFYVSCERVFQPKLEGRPVVVLSNNDGCIISRSNEAKKLGFKMAEPVFKRKELIEQHKVAVFSSNYSLYGDMSQRMMDTLAVFAPQIEVYSIDEAFLDLEGVKANLDELAKLLKYTVHKNVGIPVGVGIAASKSLAKIANKIAKKNEGTFVIDSERARDWALRNTPIEDVWGIGRQYSAKLAKSGIKTAHDFTQFDEQWVHRHYTVQGHRLWQELMGISCIPIETLMQPKKNIATTRAFGKKLSDIRIVEEAVATHAVRCAEKLRRQRSVAQYVMVFIHTDPFSENERYVSKNITYTLPLASNTNSAMASAAVKGLKQIFEPGLLYKKAGVIVSGISSEMHVQGSLFDSGFDLRHKQLSQVSDRINSRYGRDFLKLGIQGARHDWKLRQERLSGRYTTCWDEIMKVFLV